jgi:NADH-quinone oxidoreductase subunit M
MVLLTAMLSFLCIVASWNIRQHVRGYFTLFLLLDTSMMGVFCALDFFLFYVFWELMLLPMYFLIGVWGGPKKEYAAIKFFLFTLVGSVLMLIVMVICFFGSAEPTTGLHTFDLTILADQSMHQSLLLNTNIRWLCYFALLIGFCIKIPVVPLHTWLPDAHVGSADCRQRHSGRRSFENGGLRDFTDFLPPASGHGFCLCSLRGSFRCDQYYIRRPLCHGPAGS